MLAVHVLGALFLLLKLPSTLWPLVNGIAAVLALSVSIAFLLAFITGARGRPMLRRAWLFSLATFPVLLVLSLVLTN
jgi:hypothetical protein